MDSGLSSFALFLSVFWFVVYWILGGVFFAVIAIIRLGRVRKVRFSCLFTLLALVCGIGAAQFGVKYAKDAIAACTLQATDKVQQTVGLFGCGFSGIMSSFLVGACVLLLAGFLFMELSKTKTKPWIQLDQEQEDEEEEQYVHQSAKQSKYF